MIWQYLQVYLRVLFAVCLVAVPPLRDAVGWWARYRWAFRHSSYIVTRCWEGEDFWKRSSKA